MSVASKPELTHGITFHLTPEEVWLAQAAAAMYEPEGFAEEGFIHCTNGEDEVLAVGNRYYQADPRPYVILALDIALVRARVRYDDSAMNYPHIYGPLDREAVITVRAIERDEIGTFMAIQ